MLVDKGIPAKFCLVLPSFSSGGQERVMSQLADYLVVQGHKVTLLLLTKSNHFYKVDDRVDIIEPDYVLGTKSRFYFTMKSFVFLRRNLKRLCPTAILSFGGKYNSFVLIASHRLGSNVFVSDRSRPGISYGFLQDLINPICYKWAKGIIAQTNEAKEYLLASTKHRNVRVIGNPIRSIPIGHHRLSVVLSVGRLIPSKQHSTLIKNFCAVAADNWELWIAGDGPERSNLESLIDEGHLSCKVKLLGNVKDIDALYQKASVFAFSSKSEGFPNALGEAMSAGLPSISYDCPAGPADLIQHGKNGLLVPIGDESYYRECLQTLMNDAQLCQELSFHARQSISENQSLKVIGGQFEKFLLNENFS